MANGYAEKAKENWDREYWKNRQKEMLKDDFSRASKQPVRRTTESLRNKATTGSERVEKLAIARRKPGNVLNRTIPEKKVKNVLRSAFEDARKPNKKK